MLKVRWIYWEFLLRQANSRRYEPFVSTQVLSASRWKYGQNVWYLWADKSVIYRSHHGSCCDTCHKYFKTAWNWQINSQYLVYFSHFWSLHFFLRWHIDSLNCKTIKMICRLGPAHKSLLLNHLPWRLAAPSAPLGSKRFIKKKWSNKSCTDRFATKSKFVPKRIRALKCGSEMFYWLNLCIAVFGGQF